MNEVDCIDWVDVLEPYEPALTKEHENSHWAKGGIISKPDKPCQVIISQGIDGYITITGTGFSQNSALHEVIGAARLVADIQYPYNEAFKEPESPVIYPEDGEEK